MKRIAFLGTPGAAIASLRSLQLEFEVVLVVTQPDRPRGRSRRPISPEVKLEAERLGLDIAQPEDRIGLEQALGSAGALDLAVVVAYGRLLGPETLEMPRMGVLNLHFSLLPRWRGAAPIARALMAGDTMTGATIIRLDSGLDTGPVLTAQALDIKEDETAGELMDRVSVMGSRLLTNAVEGYLQGDVVPVPQSEAGLTYADKLTARDRPIGLSGGRREAHDRVRGLSPEPAATVAIDGEVHQLFRSHLVDITPDPGEWSASDDGPVLGFGDGGLLITEIQAPGRKRMEGAAWLRGRSARSGRLG